MKIDACPVTHISLHIKLRDMERDGTLTSRRTYHPGIGEGSEYLFEGRPLAFKMGYKGDTVGLNTNMEQPLVFVEPHDVAYDFETKTLLAFAKSL